jgi:hypothetical protein
MQDKDDRWQNEILPEMEATLADRIDEQTV